MYCPQRRKALRRRELYSRFTRPTASPVLHNSPVVYEDVADKMDWRSQGTLRRKLESLDVRLHSGRLRSLRLAFNPPIAAIGRLSLIGVPRNAKGCATRPLPVSCARRQAARHLSDRSELRWRQLRMRFEEISHRSRYR